MVIKPGDPAYDSWNDRGVNLRFKGRPSCIISVSTIEELSQAFQQTVDQGLYVVVRGGGHCLENFVANPSVEVIIDISKMKGIRHDPQKKAIEVMAGETLPSTRTPRMLPPRSTMATMALSLAVAAAARCRMAPTSVVLRVTGANAPAGN